MSTLNVANISDGTDTVETGYVINGSAKVYVNFSGQGVYSIRSSLNLSGLTDNGTGNFSGNFVSNMSANTYSVVSGISESGVAGVAHCSVGDGYTSSDFLMLTANVAEGSANVLTDYKFVQTAVHGDLA